MLLGVTETSFGREAINKGIKVQYGFRGRYEFCGGLWLFRFPLSFARKEIVIRRNLEDLADLAFAAVLCD